MNNVGVGGDKLAIRGAKKNVSSTGWAAAGVLFVLGAGIAWSATSYEIGTLRRMGPGYFPMLLGIALCLLSGLVLADSHTTDGVAKPRVSLRRHGRALLFPLGAILMFAALIKAAGFVPSVLVCTILAGLADPTNRIFGLVLIAVAVAVIAAVVFVYALGVPVRLFAI